MSNQPPQGPAADSMIIDQGPPYPMLARYLGDGKHRFGHQHEQENIAQISSNLQRKIQGYEDGRAKNPWVYPDLMLTGEYEGDGKTYDFTPGAAGGLEDTLRKIFRNHAATGHGNLAEQVEYYLCILSWWNINFSPQPLKFRGLRGEEQRDRNRRLSNGEPPRHPPPWRRKSQEMVRPTARGAPWKDDPEARLAEEEMVVERKGDGKG